MINKVLIEEYPDRFVIRDCRGIIAEVFKGQITNIMVYGGIVVKEDGGSAYTKEVFSTSNTVCIESTEEVPK